MYPVSEQLIAKNRSNEHLSPIGFVIHSTDNTQDTAQGERNYFNNNNLKASVHYFVGSQIIRCVPENEVAWGCGPTGNHRYLQVEMCEGEPFSMVWDKTVWLVADANVRYGWTTGLGVFSHRGISVMYKETDHTDPIMYLQRNGKTWDQLLAAIDAEIVCMKNPKIVIQEVKKVKQVVVFFSSGDYSAALAVSNKLGGVAMFCRNGVAAVHPDALAAGQIFNVGGPKLGHANEVYMSGPGALETMDAVVINYKGGKF
jgi:N-acetylmuramoyl-L-alanine amidase